LVSYLKVDRSYWLAMGQLETKIGNMVHGMLMPKQAPDWYAGGNRMSSFPEAPQDSMLLLGHIKLAVPQTEAARLFYVEGLGGQLHSKDQENQLCISAGASQFRLLGADTPEGAEAQSSLASEWPGHFYVWVEDSSKTLDSCLKAQVKLGVEVVKEVHNVTDEHTVDAILLHDPTDTNMFIVNEAPKGKMVENMRTVFSCCGGNLLGIIDATHLVHTGASAAVARFYQHYLGAAVSKKKEGWGVHFSLGAPLHQTLTFVEDEEVPPPSCNADETLPVPEICMYLPTKDRFRQAFNRLLSSGLLLGSQLKWEDSEKASEFSFRDCPDPETSTIVLRLTHIIRTTEHPEYPVQADIDGCVVGA